MMHATLYWGKDVTLLFDSCKTDSWPIFLLLLFVCFLAAALHPFLEDQRLRFTATARPRRQPLIPKPTGGRGWARRAAAAAMFGASSALGYLLMLAVMSFNGGVMTAIVAGLSVGYFVYRGDGVDDEEIVIAAVDCPC